MKTTELIFLSITGFFYLLSLIVNLLSTEEKVSSSRDWFFWFGVLSHLWTIAIRWELVKHPPVMGTYEATLAGTFVSVCVLAIFKKYYPEFRRAYITFLVVILLLLLYGINFVKGYLPLTISEQGAWILLHATTAWLALGFYILALVLAINILLSKGKQNRENFVLLDELMFFALYIGFIFLTIMMVIGAYYSFVLFGMWWRWDPIESVALISWLVSTLVIHIRLFYKWRGRNFAYLVLVAFMFVFILYKGIPLLPRHMTYHNFDLEL